MPNNVSVLLKDRLQDFKLPRYKELPSIGLYMDQLLQIIETSLCPIFGDNGTKWITTSMINNYIKQGLVKKTHSKKYDREHIASLLYIFCVKNVMPISDIQKLFSLQQQTCDMETAYDYFCREFEAALKTTFAGGTISLDIENKKSEEAFALRLSAITAAQQIYLNEYLAEIKKDSYGESE